MSGEQAEVKVQNGHSGGTQGGWSSQGQKRQPAHLLTRLLALLPYLEVRLVLNTSLLPFKTF